MVEAQYRISLAEFVVANTLAFKTRGWLAFLAALPIGAFLFTVYMQADDPYWVMEPEFWRSNGARILLVTGFALLGMLAWLAGMFVFFYIPFSTWRVYKLGEASRHVTMIATSDCLEFRDRVGNQSIVKWAALRNVFESRSLFLLRLRMGMIILIPKRALSSDQRSEFRALVRSSGVPTRIR